MPLLFRYKEIEGILQGCGSGSGLDPDSMTLWTLIRNPDPWARNMKKKIFYRYKQ
jgi:hypothetical protein